MKLYRLLLAALLYALPTAAYAQCTGTFESGRICGNSNAGTSIAASVTISAMFDRVFGSTQSAMIYRGPSGWAASTTLPTLVQDHITRVGTLVSGAIPGSLLTGSVSASLLTGTIPNAVQDNITRTGTITSGAWHGSPIANAYLANPSITIGSTNIALGATASTITGLASPTVASDAATKDYVDSVAAGRNYHPAALVATTGVLPNTPTYNNGASGVGATLTAGANAALVVDGVTISTLGSYVLVKDQASQLQNGEYTLTQVGVAGGGGTPWILTRATTMDAVPEVAAGDTVFVTSGTQNNNTTWTQTQTIAVIGTDPLVFVQTGGAGNDSWGISSTDIFNTNAGEVQISNGVLSAAQVRNTQAVFYLRSTGAFNSEQRFYSSSSTLEATIASLNGAGTLAFFTGAASARQMTLDNSGVKFDSLAGLGTGCPAVDATGRLTGVAIACIPPVGDPSGVSTSTAAFVAAYGVVKRIVLPPAAGGTTATYRFATNITFPTGTELTVPCGILLAPDGGVTVRNNGVTKGGQCQIASGSGTTYLGRDVRIDWWPSTGGDDALAFNAADASTVDAAAQSADGTQAAVRLSCKAYTFKTAAIAHASSTNPQWVEGCGADITVITCSSTGVFARGCLTQAGRTSGSGSDLMSFTWRDFAVVAGTANQAIQCITLGTTGNAIRSFTANTIERVKVDGCNVGIGIYNTRLVNFVDMFGSVRGDLDNNAAVFLMDFDDDNQFIGDFSIIRGQFQCANAAATGGKGQGIRMKSHRTGSNISGIRMQGVWYYCNHGVQATWSGACVCMGDHWILPGSQFEQVGNIVDYSGSVGVRKAAMIQISGLYLTSAPNYVAQPAFRFSGGTAGEIVDVSITDIRTRGGGGSGANSRWASFENASYVTIANNRIISIEGASGPTDVIQLFNVNHATVTGNLVAPDGVASVVPNFVTANGTSAYISVVGTQAGQAVTTSFNNTSGGTGNTGSGNYPSP